MYLDTTESTSILKLFLFIFTILIHVPRLILYVLKIFFFFKLIHEHRLLREYMYLKNYYFLLNSYIYLDCRGSRCTRKL